MNKPSGIYDVAVIGAGAAGSMAAIRAARLKKIVILVERNRVLGKKILLTGNGRCNLTNTASIEMFLKKFKPNGEFYRTAFSRFSNNDLMDFFRGCGVELKVEERGRVLPITDKAASVTDVLEKCLRESGVETAYGRRVISLVKKENIFELGFTDRAAIYAKKVIIATGGGSYKATGSTGDGFVIAGRFGHTVTGLKPALVPLKTRDSFAACLQGLSFTGARITIHDGGKKNISDCGDILFTHFGLSGPLVLDISGDVAALLLTRSEVKITIDFCPDIKREELEKELTVAIDSRGNTRIKNLIGAIVPKRMAPVFLSRLNIDAQKKSGQINKKERSAIVDNLKALPFTISGSLPLDEGMVTAGGISSKEINPRTMESKIIPGIFFVGEVIEPRGLSGGYNLQQAFSTGYLAGESCAASGAGVTD